MIDILRMQFIQNHALKFVESQGKNNLNPKLSMRREIQPQFVEELNAKARENENSLTPAEKQKLKRAARCQAEFEKLKEAAANASLNLSIG